MIVMQGNLPSHVVVATSGGVDSMAVVDFLSRKHKVHMHFVHHGTDTSKKACEFLTYYALQKNIRYTISYIDEEKEPKQSQEEFWRIQRYKFFSEWKHTPVITCHHLDDCVETWIWSSLNGEGKVIPYRNTNVIRPFRLNRKEEFINWAKRHDVPWIEDESNADTKYMRNYIRHELMPHALKVNPGLHTVIRKKIKEENYV